MRNYSFSKARHFERSGPYSGALKIHSMAFREVANCRKCGKKLGRAACAVRATGLCKVCYPKLVVTCCACGKRQRVGGAHPCEHIERIPIRSWREMVLRGEFVETNETLAE